MDIILHLGAHRCASKTFQTFLWNNRAILGARGLTSWTPRRTRDGLLRGLMRHPEKVTIEDEKHGLRSLGRMRVEMARLANANQKVLLISEQNILGKLGDNIRDARLYSLASERLMRFGPAFDGHNLTVALSIRSYEDYWTSCLTSLVARGFAPPTIDQLDFLTTQPRRWRTLVRDIAAVFPQAEIVVWPFERLAHQPQAQLRALWNGDVDGLLNTAPWRNRGAELRTLNTILAMRGGPVLRDGLLEVGTRWMPFDEDQRNVLRAEYRRDLAWFAAGAEGLARFVDGRFKPDAGRAPVAEFMRYQHLETGSGRSTSAPRLTGLT